MTIVANTFLTFDSKGNREQLANRIYMISPEDTPLVSSMEKINVKGTLEEWQTDSLAAVDTANRQLQGDDVASFAAVTPTVRVGNYTQISRKTLIISGTQEAIEKAGRDSELAYQTAKRGVELKRDIEAICFAAQGGAAGNSTTAPQTAALLAWVKTNVDFGAGGVDPAWTSGVPSAARTDGTQRAFTETILKSVVQQMWTEGANVPNVRLYVGPFNKGVVSGFAGIATQSHQITNSRDQAAIIGAADVYVSNFGTFTVLPSRWQRERDAWFIDNEYLALGHLRPFMRVPLAKTGDAEKRMLLQEWLLKVKQEAALGLAADLNAS